MLHTLNKELSMKNKRKLIVIVVCVLLAGSLLFLNVNKKEVVDLVEGDRYPKTLKFSFEVNNQTSKAIKKASFFTYLPINNSGNQVLETLNVSQEYSTKASDNANRVLATTFDLIPPYGLKKITISTLVTTFSPRSRSAEPRSNIYLDEEKYIEVTNIKIAALAKKLKAETDEQSAKNIYSWVSKNLKDAGYTSHDKGALYALENSKGDCTEFMYLTIALARSLGIHARGVGGYVYSQSTLVQSSDYHNWAEFYFDGRWNVVDSQKKVFVEKSQDYITMRYISNDKASLLGSSHRFSTADENLKITML